SGDGDARNRFTRYTIADKDSTSFTSAWTATDDYHGTHDPATPQVHGAASQQPLCAIQGPADHTILWGADGNADLITLMPLPDDSGQSSSTLAYGQMTGRGLGVEPQDGKTALYYAVLNLKDLRPENSGQTSASTHPAPAVGWLFNSEAQTD